MIKKQTTKLSTRWLGSYRGIFFILLSGVFLTLLGLVLYEGGYAAVFANLSVWGFICYKLLRMAANLQQVSFDEEFLYVRQKRQELLIPLQNIQSVEIQTMGGTYKVVLYFPDQVGKEFYFKCSLLYPLNYKRKDAVVNVLRKNIEKAKMKREIIPANALHS